MEKVHVHAKFFIYRPYSQFTNQREIHITVRSFWIDRLTYQIGPILCTSMRKSLLSSLYIALCGGCKASVNCCQNRRFFCSLLPCHIRQVLWLSMTFSCGVEMVKSLSIIGTTASLKRNETLYIVGICTGINYVFGINQWSVIKYIK